MPLMSIMLFIAAGALMIPDFPTAFADNSPAITTVPLTPVIGGSMSVVVTADPLSVTHVKGKLRVYEPGKDPNGGASIYAADCTFGTTTVTGPAARKIIEFRKASDLTDANEYTMTTGGSTLSIPVTTGIIDPIEGPGVTLEEATGVWVVVEGSGGGLPASIDYLTAVEGAPYRAATCGYDGGGVIGVTFQYNQESTTSTQKPVGGMVIPIDTAALLIAGIYTNSLWTLLGLTLVAGVTFTALRFQIARKNE